jgi:ParB family chromosome partitioning protein
MKKRGLGSSFGGLIAPLTTAAAELQEVPVDAVVPNPSQPRLAFNHAALEELAASIKEHGVLQPIVVTRLNSHAYQLIAGERRLRAARLAGLEQVPVVIKEVSAQQQLELALIENVQRADLDPIEEARAYAVLEDQFGLKQGEIAQRVGKSRTTVSETLSLLKLPNEVQELVSAGQLTAGHASTLVPLRDARKEVAAARYIAAHGLSVRKAEAYVTSLAAEEGPGKQLAQASRRRLSTATVEDRAIVQALEERLDGKRVELVRAGRGGRLVIHFDNEEMLSSLYDLLMARSV